MSKNSRENCNSKISNITDHLFFLLIMVISGYIFFITRYSLNVLGFQQLNNFIVIFLSILIESLPFILIGIFLASIIEVYVSDQFIQKIIPSNTVLGLSTASLVGLIFPVCECGIIPITRKMIKKGVPAHIAITFMLAVPIVNPVVIASTLFAFSENNIYVFLRIIMGILIAISIGYLTHLFFDKSSILKSVSRNNNSISSCCSHHSHHSHYSHLNKIKEVMEHATQEFFEVAKYLIIGALLASTIQIFVPRSYILSIGGGQTSSIIVMMVFAFLISLCSEADAFIAATFLNSFSMPSIIAFMVLGPMLDIKNLLMMLGIFKKRFVIFLVILIILFVFLAVSQIGLFL